MKPQILLDEYGYPTDEWLDFIKSYVPNEQITISEFVDVMLRNGWHGADWGFVLHRKYRGKRKLELHTGGWSGNEEVIEAIKSNICLTHFKMRYVMWKTGGHYYFEYTCK